MPFCEANGIRIHYRRTGQGPSIVMLHGLLGDGACWTPIARRLELDVVMPDARGHGDSSRPADGYRYADLADDVVALIRTLELDRPILVGHSMGGMTAAVVASRSVALRGLVLVDPTFLDPERQREVYASDVAEQHRLSLARPAAELLAEARARHPQRSPEIHELQVAARLNTSLDAFAVLAPPNPDYREVMKAITVPTLLVIGDNPVVTREMASELGLEVAVIEHAGHGVPYDQPARLASAIAAFAEITGP